MLPSCSAKRNPSSALFMELWVAASTTWSKRRSHSSAWSLHCSADAVAKLSCTVSAVRSMATLRPTPPTRRRCVRAFARLGHTSGPGVGEGRSTRSIHTMVPIDATAMTTGPMTLRSTMATTPASITAIAVAGESCRRRIPSARVVSAFISRCPGTVVANTTVTPNTVTS